VHLVEERRHLLDFVDHDLGGSRPSAQLLAQKLRALHVAAEFVGFQF